MRISRFYARTLGAQYSSAANLFITRKVFLGVIVICNLSWGPDVSHLMKSKLTPIVHVFKFITRKTRASSVDSMLQLYRVLFIEFMRYSSPLLFNTDHSNLPAFQGVNAQTLRVSHGFLRRACTAGTVIVARGHSS